MAIRVTVWHEFRHEKTVERVKKIYPDGIHVVIKAALENLLGDEVTVRTATLDEPDHGLSDEVIANTDVMLWWGHAAHREVNDEIAAKVAKRVLAGMGLLVMHSAHVSKPFLKLMGTTGYLSWREAAEKERLWVVQPNHPITVGMEKPYLELPHEEMYGEPFDVPTPDELIFISWFEGGEVFRSGCVWRRGAGKIFYFRPGHESFPSFHMPEIQRILANGVKYIAPAGGVPARSGCPNDKVSLSPIASRHQVEEALHKH